VINLESRNIFRIFAEIKTFDMIRECKKHGLTEFRTEGENKFRCIKCGVEAMKRRRQRMRVEIREYKGGKCLICGYNKCIDALDFHHIDPSKKEFGFGKKSYSTSMDKLKKEADKCVLVCANCHREIHAGLIDLTGV